MGAYFFCRPSTVNRQPSNVQRLMGRSQATENESLGVLGKIHSRPRCPSSPSQEKSESKSSTRQLPVTRY